MRGMAGGFGVRMTASSELVAVAVAVWAGTAWVETKAKPQRIAATFRESIMVLFMRMLS
jgi:hypothetical protein